MSWKLNARGAPYINGASYPMKTRIQTVLTYLNTQSIAETARRERVTYNFVAKLIQQFQSSAKVGSRSFANGRSLCMPEWMKVYIEAQIIIHPMIYPKECIEMMADDFNLLPADIPSISAVKHLLNELNLTRKKCTTVARERFSPYVLQRRQEFTHWRMGIDPAKIYFFDETSFNSETDERDYGRTESGFRLPSYRRKSPTVPKYSVIGLCGFNEGFMQAIPIEGNYYADLVNDVVQYQLLPLLPRNSYLTCDNASIHNNGNLAARLIAKNITLVKLPAYSYDLNPIEMAFGLAKAAARKTPGAFEDNPMIAILDAFLEISNLTVKKFYRKSWRIMR